MKICCKKFFEWSICIRTLCSFIYTFAKIMQITFDTVGKLFRSILPLCLTIFLVKEIEWKDYWHIYAPGFVAY
jgi:hypothetical protein